ncbi:MAG: hydroxyacid dehydrogenase [Fervidicoccaceae archaeon]
MDCFTESFKKAIIPYNETLRCCLFVVVSRNEEAALSGNRYKVLISDKLDDFLVEELRKRNFEVLYLPGISREELLQLIEEFDVVVVRSRTKVDAEAIRRGKKLKVIARAGIGTDNIDVEEAEKRGIKIVTTPEAPVASVAELTIALMFALARRLHTAFQITKEGKWEKIEGIELRGKTLGILGFGRIGREVARLSHCLGMNIEAYDIKRETLSGKSYVREVESLEELLGSSDFLTIHLPLTEKTRKMIGRRELSLMKEGSFLINTSRGGIIDQEALLEALKNGKLAGAAIDVLEKEPPGEVEMKLLSLPNVIATPHIGSQTREAQRRIAIELVEKVNTILRGDAP